MLIVKHAQRFKGKLSMVNGNTELKPHKIKVKTAYWSHPRIMNFLTLDDETSKLSQNTRHAA